MRAVFLSSRTLLNLSLASSLLFAAVIGCESTPRFLVDGDSDGASKDASDSGGDNAGPGIQLGSDGGGSGSLGGSSSFDLSTFKIVYDGPGYLDVTVGNALPTAQFTATVSGRPYTVGWSVDRGELGSIDKKGLFTPTGTVGGVVTIRAGLNGKVVTQTLFIRIRASQNGSTAAQAAQVATTVGSLTEGGGIGGVGGEGLGVLIGDGDLLASLGATPADDGLSENLELLYPYAGTVFPRGMLAPLLMWRWTPGDADAIRIRLYTQSGSYDWKGSFGAPAILGTTSGKFIRHPIPQDVWAAATQSAGGTLADGTSDALKLELVLSNGGTTYGPIKRSFGVAPGKLTGKVYYNSYGTNLVTNSGSIHDFNDKPFGAAVLGIRSGETAPVVISGPASSDETGCRVCHTVSADGVNMIVQGGGNDRKSWLNDLLGSESYLTGQDSIFAWAGLSPDGAFALTNSVDVSKHNRTVDTTNYPYSQLYDMTTTPPTLVADASLPANFKAALPAFSPNGKQVAFAYLGGTGDGIPNATPTDGSKLAAMDFNPSTKKFSNFRIIGSGNTNLAANYRTRGAGWPSFLPSGKQVVFANATRGANSNETYMGTRDGERTELWWTSSTTENAVALNYLNGKDATDASYLPSGGNKHGTGDGIYDDSTLNYEPTVNPVLTGGYAWVVFTSRRMYGNLAVGDPWLSDPRDYDATDPSKITTKKLWVAAVRPDTPLGTDPSYPAFYLPAQELLAGNARGFWVLDPCAAEGTSCETGDQCCGGYCQPSGTGGALVCSDTTTTTSCAAEQEKCTTQADCCNGSAVCVNGFCSVPAPPITR